jgi:hypothetical protein
VLYEAVSGKQAWPGKPTPESMVAQGGPAPLTGVDATLTALISELLMTERGRRPRAAASVAERLRTWLAEHHPRGVQQELSERALRAQARSAAEPRPLSEPAPSSGSGRIEVRSIAVNPELAELLQHATEKLERPATTPPAPTPTPPDDTPEPRVADDPEFQRFVRRFLRDLVVITVALVIALGYAFYRAQKDEERDEAERAATATPPPSAPGPRVPTPTPEPLATGAAAPPTAATTASAAQQPSAAATSNAPQPPSAAVAHTPATPERVTPKAPAPLTTTPDAMRKNGLLSVSATPWAEVRLDGKLLGSTPRRSLPLRPGKHTLQLSCPPLAHEARVPIELQPGQELRVSADMQESPPRITAE